MSNLRRNFERFCFKHRSKGIPNLMLYVSLGTAVVYLMTMVRVLVQSLELQEMM